MAGTAAEAPSTGFSSLQMGAGDRFRQMREGLERWLESERAQLVLWLPVMLGVGITAWFLLPDAGRWIGFLLAAVATASAGGMLSGRFGRAVLVAGLMAAGGCMLIWWRAEGVAAPVLARPAVTAFQGRVARVEHLPA